MNNDVEPGMETSIQYFLDRFYMSRISIRMLINQHSKFALDDAHWSLLERVVLENFTAILFGQVPQTTEHIGCIEIDCNPRSVVNDAYENARWLCDQYYLGAPEMEIIEHNGELKLLMNSTWSCTETFWFTELENSEPIKIVYVPSHLYHILFELFKNSMRAVMETHQDSGNIPPIRVTIVKGKEDISVKISDLGGGIARSQVDQLFKYMYSTAPQPSKSDMHTVPLAGKYQTKAFFLPKLLNFFLYSFLKIFNLLNIEHKTYLLVSFVSISPSQFGFSDRHSNCSYQYYVVFIQSSM